MAFLADPLRIQGLHPRTRAESWGCLRRKQWFFCLCAICIGYSCPVPHEPTLIPQIDKAPVFLLLEHFLSLSLTLVHYLPKTGHPFHPVETQSMQGSSRSSSPPASSGTQDAS